MTKIVYSTQPVEKDVDVVVLNPVYFTGVKEEATTVYVQEGYPEVVEAYESSTKKVTVKPLSEYKSVRAAAKTADAAAEVVNAGKSAPDAGKK